MSLKLIYSCIKQYSDPKRAQSCQRYFKTAPGQYGEGDQFLGLNSAQIRSIVKQNALISFKQVQQLLESEFHEHRSIGLLILSQKFKKKNQKREVYDFYLKSLKYVNNWDLVDLTAPNIIGMYLLSTGQKRNILYELCKSNVIWQRRISIISTLTFIRANQFQDTLNISLYLLKDNHDLIHKAVGWMLRQIGKRNVQILEQFIKKNYFQIPRTALRYSIEKFPEQKRKRYLKGQF